MSVFALHPRLAADCTVLGDWPLCRLLLADDARWPWCILVPRRVGLVELHQLVGAEREQLWSESQMLSLALRAVVAACERLNVAALGNMVPQLHLHHVVRGAGDPNWPGPVWGHGERQSYTPARREAFIASLLAALPQAPSAPG